MVELVLARLDDGGPIAFPDHALRAILTHARRAVRWTFGFALLPPVVVVAGAGDGARGTPAQKDAA